MFQDEARFGLIVDVRRCWCPRPHRPVCRARISRQYTYAYAAVSVDGELDTLVLPHVNSDCMQRFIDELAARHPDERLVLVMDGAGWHDNTLLQWPNNVYPMILPRYSPELNPVECLWEELREKHFHNRLFDELDDVQDHLADSLRALELDRQRVQSITAWPWIVDSLPN